MGSGSFSSNDSSSLSPCGNSDAPTSSSDIQTARKRSKSLPELDSVADGASEDAQERPASAEGAVKETVVDLSKDSSEVKTISSSTLHSTSNGQRKRLYSSPNMQGTVPLSHAPVPSAASKSSLSSTSFAVPRMNYGSMHHPGPYGPMYSGFTGYQSYNATPNMPTQSTYPPTYNPYSGTTGLSYVSPSGPPGSALYNTTSRPPPPSYTTHHNMINYMSYQTNLPSDGRQAAALTSYNAPTYPYNSAASLPVASTSSNHYSTSTQDLSHLSLPTTVGGCAQPPVELGTQGNLTSPNSNTSISCSNASTQEIKSSNERSSSKSPQNLNSPMIGVNGCDSTTTCTEAVAPTEQAEMDSVCVAEENAGRVQEGNELQYYATRYVK